MNTKTPISLTLFLGDITHFFEMGRRFTNLSASHGRGFCGSSNRLLGSMLVMFLRASRWKVGACAFHIKPAKRTLRMSTKLAFLPTFVLPVAEIVPLCATGCFGWHCLQSGDWTSPLFPTGVPSVMISVIMLVKIASHPGKAVATIVSTGYIFKEHRFSLSLY